MPQADPHISVYIDPFYLDDRGWLLKEIRSWCMHFLSDYCEKRTPYPERPLAVYFSSLPEKQKFLNVWSDAVAPSS